VGSSSQIVGYGFGLSMLTRRMKCRVRGVKRVKAMAPGEGRPWPAKHASSGRSWERASTDTWWWSGWDRMRQRFCWRTDLWWT